MNAVIDILKKNLLSLICGLIAVLAVFAALVPLNSKFKELQAKVDQRAQEYTSLDSLVKKQRTLPSIDPSDPEQKILDGFPTEANIKVVQGVADQIKAEGQAVLDLASKLNERPLLVPGSLPAGLTSFSVRYQGRYQQMMDFTNTDENIRRLTMPVKLLHAGSPPNEADIQAERYRREDEIKRDKLLPGNPGSEQTVAAEIAQMQATVADEMRKDAATKNKMYINPDALDIYPNVLNVTKPPDAAVIYFSQLGLWVQEDVFAALATVNRYSTKVADSPVKHLVKIDVIEDGGRTPAGAGSAAGYAGVPSGLPPGMGGMTPGMAAEMAMAAGPGGPGGIMPGMGTGYGMPGAPMDPGAAGGAGAGTASPTGRASNSIYDVVPFRLVIYVDARQIPQILTELSRNKFITVLKCDIASVDMATATLGGYYYGLAPVVSLSMDCEALFLRSWTTKYMPPSVAGPPAVVPG